MSRLGLVLARARAVFTAIAHWLWGLPTRPRKKPFLAWLLRSEENNARFAGVCTVVFVVHLIWAHTHHVPWRDEAHPWLLARQADGWWDILVGDRRYDGHPPGWYWLLHVASFFTREAWGLQATTIVVASLTAFVFLRCAPFPRPVRVVLVAGYYLSFEYAVLCRNYDLGLLFAFAFAALLHPLRPRPLLLAAMLVGLALSSVYGLIMAGALSLVLLAESSRLRGVRQQPGLVAVVVERRGLIALALVAAGLGLSFWATHPPDPNAAVDTFHGERLTPEAWRAALDRITCTFLPLRIDGDPAFWYTHDQIWSQHPELLATAGWVLCAVVAACLLPHPVEALALVLGVVGFVVVQVAVYMGGIRHWAHAFLLFLVLCWTARRRRAPQRGALIPLSLFIVGLFQCQATWVATRTAAQVPFSSGPLVAARLKQPDLATLPLVGGPDSFMPAVMIHLDRTFISCETDEWNQTVVFHARRHHCTPMALLERAISVSREQGVPVSLVSPTSLTVPKRRARLDLLLVTPKPTLTHEDFYLYRVTAR